MESAGNHNDKEFETGKVFLFAESYPTCQKEMNMIVLFFLLREIEDFISLTISERKESG